MHNKLFVFPRNSYIRRRVMENINHTLTSKKILNEFGTEIMHLHPC